MLETHWIFRRINLPEWAVRIIEGYQRRYNKSAAEVTREALCDLAHRIAESEED